LEHRASSDVLFAVKSMILPAESSRILNEISVKGILFLPKVFLARFNVSTTKVVI